MRRKVNKSAMISVELQIPADVVEQLKQITGITDASEAVKSIVKQWHEAHNASAAPVASHAPISGAKPRHNAPPPRRGAYPASASRSARPDNNVPTGNSRQASSVSSAEPLAAGREEHPIKAYQRRLREEELHKQRVRRGGNVNRTVGNGPANRSAGNRPAANRPPSTPDNNRYESKSAAPRPPRPPRSPRPK